MLNSNSFMQPAAAPYASMNNWGQLGTGTYPTAPGAEMFSQPPAMTDWTQQILQPNMGGGVPTIPMMGASAPATGGGMLDSLGSFFKNSGFLGSTDASGTKTDGWGGLAVGAAGGLASAYLGMKQYGLAKDTLAENKKQFNLNYDAQRTTTNTALEDRQRARVASNSGAYQSVGDYMSTNGIK